MPVGTLAVWGCKNKEPKFPGVCKTNQCFAGQLPGHLCSRISLEPVPVVDGNLLGKSVGMDHRPATVGGLSVGHVFGPLQRLQHRKSFSVQDLKVPHKHLIPPKIWLWRHLNHQGSYQGDT